MEDLSDERCEIWGWSSLVKYVSGNSGKEILFNNYEIGIGSGNPYFTKWKYTGTQKQFGIDITQFEKDPVTLPIVFRFRGSKRSIKENEKLFFEECEKDILQMKAGTFCVNDWKLKGYFIERETSPSEEFYGDDMSTTFLAPYPFWIEEQDITISPIIKSITSDEEGLKTYPYTYPYTYPTSRTQVAVNIDHYMESDFQMKVYGATDSVHVNIAGHPYIVEYPLDEGEYMVIDSRPYVAKDKRLYVVKNDGKAVNVFHYRDTEHSVFQKIPAGSIIIDYSRTYGIDLTIFKERSEPLWS